MHRDPHERRNGNGAGIILPKQFTVSPEHMPGPVGGSTIPVQVDGGFKFITVGGISPLAYMASLIAAGASGKPQEVAEHSLDTAAAIMQTIAKRAQEQARAMQEQQQATAQEQGQQQASG